jgi:hypothetical protein
MPLTDKIPRHARLTRYQYEQGDWQENEGNVTRSYYLHDGTTPYLVVYLGMAIGGGTPTTPDNITMDNPTMLYGASQASFDTSWKSFEFNYSAAGSGDSHAYRLIGWNIPQSAMTSVAGYPIICSAGQSAEDRYGHGVLIFKDRNTTMDTMDNRITSGMLLSAPASQSITATKDSVQVGLWTTRGATVQSSVGSPGQRAEFYFTDLPRTASAVIGFGFQIWTADDLGDNASMNLRAIQGLGLSSVDNRLNEQFLIRTQPDYGRIEIIDGADLEKNKMLLLASTLHTTDTTDGHEFLTLLII